MGFTISSVERRQFCAAFLLVLKKHTRVTWHTLDSKGGESNFLWRKVAQRRCKINQPFQPHNPLNPPDSSLLIWIRPEANHWIRKLRRQVWAYRHLGKMMWQKNNKTLLPTIIVYYVPVEFKSASKIVVHLCEKRHKWWFSLITRNIHNFIRKCLDIFTNPM